MSQFGEGDLYAGLTNLVLSDSAIEFGAGVSLRRCFARFLTPLALENTSEIKFEPSGMPRPAVWHLSSMYFEVSAELCIAKSAVPDEDRRFETAQFLVKLIRLWSNPAVTMPVISTNPLGGLVDTPEGAKLNVRPIEVWPAHFPLGLVDESKMADSISWIQAHWEQAFRLYRDSAEFRLAVDALDAGQFVPNTALALVSLWGALEAIFSPATTELKFRVSALIAAFLEPPGIKRLEKQREVASLYDKRSAAAHGKPRHESGDLLKTFELLRKVLIRMIQDGRVPTKQELEARLFGAS